ncbi:MAG TPA: TrmH family RNA methyltransferase [Bacilli bacterium]|nr:TrmH family RNA methyltransferase [Bacilli bacterium]
MKQIGISDPIIKHIRSQKRQQTNRNIVLVEDLFIISLARKYEFEIELFLYCPEVCYKAEHDELVHHLANVAKESYEISAKTYESIVDKENSAGLFIIVRKEYGQKPVTLPENAFVLVVDRIENPGNLGTIIRTADAVDVDLFILVDGITHSNSVKTTASSRGMNLIVPIWETSFEEANEFLDKHQVTRYLGEPVEGLNYRESVFRGSIAIVVGNERFGINQKWYEYPHEKTFIPMYGEMTSLNVGVATSILLYEALSKRKL